MTRNSPEGIFSETLAGIKPAGLVFPNEPISAATLGALSAVSLYIPQSNSFININDSGWATIDRQKSSTFVIVPYNQYYYIVVASGNYKGAYLSYNNNDYVGAYSSWGDASYWEVDPINCQPRPGLYPYNDYLCCNGVKDSAPSIVTVVAQ